MAMAKHPHTPGPWSLDDEASHPWIVTCPVDGFPELPGKVCEVGYLPNARLIAAAPELLAGLVAAEDFMSGFEGDELQDGIDDKLATIRAAISKAEGR